MADIPKTSLTCIGGPLDGKDLEVQDGVRHVYVPTRRSKGFVKMVYKVFTRREDNRKILKFEGYDN